jgi:hypothetical protein
LWLRKCFIEQLAVKAQRRVRSAAIAWYTSVARAAMHATL